MKKAVLLFVMVCFVFASASLYAADEGPSRRAAVQAKVHQLSFTDDVAGVDLDKGWYFGVEGMFALTEHLLLCPEVGYVKTDNDDNATVTVDGEPVLVKIDLDTVKLIPVELNLKYSIPFAKRFVWAIGAGVSYNYFKIKADAQGTGFTAEKDDWVWGGQLMTELKWKFHPRWFSGLNFKYQITDDMSVGNENVKATNWRIGPSIGFIF
jgi:hypothetical protein